MIFRLVVDVFREGAAGSSTFLFLWHQYSIYQKPMYLVFLAAF